MMAAEGEIQVYVCDTLGQRGNVATSTEGKRRIGEGVVGHNRRHYSELRIVSRALPTRRDTIDIHLAILRSMWYFRCHCGEMGDQAHKVEVCFLTVTGNRSVKLRRLTPRILE